MKIDKKLPDGFWFEDEHATTVTVLGTVDKWCVVEDINHIKPYLLLLDYVFAIYEDSIIEKSREGNNKVIELKKEQSIVLNDRYGQGMTFTVELPDGGTFNQPNSDFKTNEVVFKSNKDMVFCFKDKDGKLFNSSLSYEKVKELLEEEAYLNLPEDSCCSSTCQVNGFCECGSMYDEMDLELVTISIETDGE